MSVRFGKGGAAPSAALLIALAPAGSVACGLHPAPEAAPLYAVEEKTVAELGADLAAGRITSERLVRAYLARIDAIDRSGPTLGSVLSVNPNAVTDARRLDEERAQGRARGPLHGIPILVKDNIETADPVPTTAGSLALRDNETGRDAPIVARLRAAGAVILGKTNLSEWANIRSSQSTSGWSAVGGLTRNPYALDRNACGSSSGSAAAVAASLAALAIGTETDGSIVCPSSVNGLVGLKPTVGLLSRRHIVPISRTQDTPGPMARAVADAAAMLAVMAGSDPEDPATGEADRRKADYVAALSHDALKGKRLGVMRFEMGYLPAVDAAFERAASALEAAGAVLVDIRQFAAGPAIRANEIRVLLTELKDGLNQYLSGTPSTVTTRTLADVIAFNKTQSAREMPYFGQDLFEQAEASAGVSDPAYLSARGENLKMAGPAGIDRMLTEHALDGLIAPTAGPAWPTDLVNGDHFLGSAASLAAAAGYPHVTVPMGQVHGLPVGLSLVGAAWSEAKLLAMGYAFEQLTRARTPPRFAPSLDRLPEITPSLSPAAARP